MDQAEIIRDWLRRGYRVFPARVMPDGDKRPAIEGWQKLAASTPEDAAALFADFPDALVGLALKEDQCVIDLDVKGDVDGLSAWTFAYGEPDTLTVRTRSGGLHLHFTCPEPVKNTVGRLAPGVDTRGARGFVLAPGQAGYSLVRDTGTAALPPDVAALIRRGATSAPNDPGAVPIQGWDAPEAVAAAERYAASKGPVEYGIGIRNQSLVEFLLVMWDIGVSQETAARLSDEWMATWEVALDEDEAAKTVRSIYTAASRDNAPGELLDQYRVPDVSLQGMADAFLAKHPSTAARPRRFSPLPLSSLLALPPSKWIVDNLLPEGEVAVFYGPTNHGKSFVVMDLLHSLAGGLDEWFERDIYGGPRRVLYVTGEGRGSIGKRSAGWVLDHPDVDLSDRLSFLLNMPRFADVDDMVEFVEEAAALAPHVVVFDTVSLAMAGAFDENKNDEAYKFLMIANGVAERLKCAVILVAHSGKDKDGGIRGASVLTTNPNTVVKIIRNERSNDIDVIIEKQKDGATGHVATLETAKIDVRESIEEHRAIEEGEDTTTLVLRQGLREIDVDRITSLKYHAAVVNFLSEHTGTAEKLPVSTSVVADMLFRCYHDEEYEESGGDPSHPVADKRLAAIGRYLRRSAHRDLAQYVVRVGGKNKSHLWSIRPQWQKN